ncbi:MAG: hypothetical protein WA324_23835 [Bryobacteraceae bacterium]
MTPLSPPLDPTHVTANKLHFQEARYQPDKVLEAQKALWRTLGVDGATQRTAAENFLIIGEPFKDDDGTICSKVFNQELFKPYKEPCLTTLHSSDTCSNVKKRNDGMVVWKHVGDDEGQVRDWYAGIGAEAKDGRVLFNLHYKDAWEALFHEPVHEAAPSGGIGTSPRWTYEGYCEIFAKQLAACMGFTGYNIESGPYGAYAREVQKLIDFTSETYVARAYFVNDEWSYSLLAPLWYRSVLGHDISGNLAHYIPAELVPVPSKVDDLLKAVRRPAKPAWYKRWVGLFGTTQQMPALTAVGGLGGLPKLGFPPTKSPVSTGTPLPTQTGPQVETIVTNVTFNSYMRKFWAVDK